MKQVSAYSSWANFTYVLPNICSPILSATTNSTISPNLMNSKKTSSKKSSKWLAAFKSSSFETSIPSEKAIAAGGFS